jgi:uncharacterized protein (DUF736 family)
MQEIGKLDLGGLAAGILTIDIPFQLKTLFDLWENTKKAADNHPDFLIMYNDTKYGVLWEKTSKKGNRMMSGNLTTPILNVQLVIMLEDSALGTYKGKIYIAGGKDETQVSN